MVFPRMFLYGHHKHRPLPHHLAAHPCWQWFLPMQKPRATFSVPPQCGSASSQDKLQGFGELSKKSKLSKLKSHHASRCIVHRQSQPCKDVNVCLLEVLCCYVWICFFYARLIRCLVLLYILICYHSMISQKLISVSTLVLLIVSAQAVLMLVLQRPQLQHQREPKDFSDQQVST